MGIYGAQCKKCTFGFIAKKISNELKLKNLVQGNIVILKHCDARKGMATTEIAKEITWNFKFQVSEMTKVCFYRMK